MYVVGICFATKSSNAEKARSSIREAFFYELKQGMVSDITVIANCSIIAAVGYFSCIHTYIHRQLSNRICTTRESMSNMPGVSGLFFSALGGASVNVLSISQVRSIDITVRP